MFCIQGYSSRVMNNCVLSPDREPMRETNISSPPTFPQRGGEKVIEEQLKFRVVILRLSRFCSIGYLLIICFALGITFHHLTIIIIEYCSLRDESSEYLDTQ